MIKSLKVSDKTVRKFKSSKSWTHSTIDSHTGIVLEQTLNNGLPVNLQLDSNLGLATEQFTNNTDIKIKYGKKTTGTFYPVDHPSYDKEYEKINYDGSYYRNVYNSVKHLFYNEYGIYSNESYIKNPLMVFGSETGQYKTETSDSNPFGDRETGYERRVVNDEILVIEISNKNFGEQIKPNSFRILDYSSPHGVIEIVDDGATNLTISDNSFNEIKDIKRSKSRLLNKESYDNKTNTSDMLVGKKLASDGDYILTGVPMNQDSPSDLLTGSASLFRYDANIKEFRSVREFMCPFTQSGIINESKLNSNNFLVTELGDLISSRNYSINDKFGESVELKNGTCAIGSPESHIHGVCNDARQGHVFLYDVDKGGSENWGLTEIIEGDPGSEFGSSISIHGKYMAIGSPGAYKNQGAIYLFEKSIRTKTTPWWRISDVHSDFCFNEVSKTHRGLPVCDKLKELNESAYRWKIRTASPENYGISPFGVDGDECELEQINLFDEDEISSFGYETNFPVSNYHEFEKGKRTPEYGEGDITWKLVSIIKTNKFNRLGENIKLSDGILTSSSPSSDHKKVAVFRKNTSADGCDIWTHTQSINKNFIYNYDYENAIVSRYFNDIRFELESDSITIEVDVKQIPETTDSGFIYRFDKIFGEGTDRFNSRILHGGSVVDSNKFKLNDVPPGEHKIYIGRYVGKYLVGVPSVISFSINPSINEVEERASQVKYPYKYYENKYTNFGVSIETNGKHLLVGDDYDRVYVDTDIELTKGVSYSSGAVWLYEIENDTVSYVKKIYELESEERRYNNRFGCSVSMIGNDFLIGAPCTDESKIILKNKGNEIKIPDYELGVETYVEEFYEVHQSLFTSFEYEYIGDGDIDMLIYINIHDLININLESINDFEIAASFLKKEKNKIDTRNGELTRGIYKNKNKLDDNKICFFVKVNSHLFDPTEKVEFIYSLKRNSIQGTVSYMRLIENNEVVTLKNIKSVKQQNKTKTSFGISVSISSTRIYSGNSIIGDWPIDQITGFDDTEIVSFDDCSHIYSQRGDIIWGNLEKTDLILEGSILAYDVKTIRDGERVYVGNIFYKNGIAVISELSEYYENLLKYGGRNGYEISFDGINSVYENEILCKVSPHEFNTSTNPTSVIKRDIAFDVNGDGKFDIVDLSFIYRYILGSFKRARVDDTETGELSNTLVLEQNTDWPNEDVLMSESEDALFINVLQNLTVDMELSKVEELRILDTLDTLASQKQNGLDVDGDGVVSANDAKLIARYFVGRVGKSLTSGLINPLTSTAIRKNSYQIVNFLDEKTGKYAGREIIKDFLDYETNDLNDKQGSYMAPYATAIGLYDGSDLVMVAKLGKPVKIIPNYPINFLVKYDV
jgi:hypothetical protein